MNLIIPSVFLSVFGLFNLFGLNQELFFRQLVYCLVGFGLYFLVKSIGRHFFRANSRFFYYFFLVALAVTYIVGVEARGSKRWLDFFLFRFQASEFFKPFFILFLSEYLFSGDVFKNDLNLFLKSFVYFFVPFFIIFKQPDLANAGAFLFIYLLIVFFSKIPKKYLFSFFGAVMAMLPLGWFFLKGYQKARLVSFMSPHLDTQGIAYNMIQAMITVGSGKFFGRGLGLGTQSRLFFLPENTTDFAFASLVEQFGFFGGFFIIFFYGLLIYFVAKRTIKFYFDRTEEGRSKFLYCLGMLVYLSFQVFINVGMNMGLMPVAGVALPFISYGGSSILALLIGFALMP
ncbi:FtsW/RodA/SpoVE family cell cycle protein [Patescibacteria group bacterium]|nr:FtsW/RodA/SpoVE family cell cycle protein [Patescibacteria group bacterium]